ncbi:MAG TPA: Gfo/Idh/MocA family oxidoreductase [Mycobacteriales bacterium]
MRVGLLGAGRIGEFHAATLRDHPQVECLLVGDIDPCRAVALADKLDAVAAGGPFDVLDAGLDAVIIAASTSAHPALVGEAAARGLPVFCEKPIALDVVGTRSVLERVARAGIPLQVGFQRRFDTGYLRAREALRDGALGTLHAVRMVGADPAPPHASYLPTSGGIFRDLLIHDFDALRWLTGRDIVRVYATGVNRGAPDFGACGDVDTAACLLWLDDGTLATVTGSRYNGAGYDIRMELAGTHATIAVGLDDRTPLRSCEQAVAWPAGRSWSGFLDRFAPAYVSELHEFIEVALGHRPSPCPGTESLEALYVAAAADRSLAEGRAVRVDEVR